MANHSGIQLFVGLGNPGAQYAATRHNAGFWWIDSVAAGNGCKLLHESKFSGDAGRLKIHANEAWLLKPATFMNKSGRAVAALANFYKIPPEAILVIHDELDLPAGSIKLKKGGGHGGHNGLRDSIAAVGADFWRLRLGIGHPGHKDQVLDYVLQRASAADEQCINEAILKSADLLPVLLFEGAEKAMNRLHTQDQ